VRHVMVLFYHSFVQVHKYMWLVLDRDNIPCFGFYVDGVLNESETEFPCLGVVDSFWRTAVYRCFFTERQCTGASSRNGSVPVLLHVVYTYERVISYLHTD
jgi:hypothetical protein